MHIPTRVIPRHRVREQHVRQQLRERARNVQHGDIEEERSSNAKQVSCIRIGGGDPDVQAAQWVGNQQAEDELDAWC